MNTNTEKDSLSSYQQMLVEMGAASGEVFDPDVYVHIALDGTPSGTLKSGNGLSLSVDTENPDVLLRLLGYLDVAKAETLRKLSAIDAPDLPEKDRLL